MRVWFENRESFYDRNKETLTPAQARLNPSAADAAKAAMATKGISTAPDPSVTTQDMPYGSGPEQFARIYSVSAVGLLLGTDRSPHESFVQVAGSSALRIATDQYLAAIRQSESLRTTLLRYVQTTLVQSAQSTATNASHRVEGRLARWLLMCHDRLVGDEIALTHEFMSMMISADRSGVTVTLHILEGAGMIRSKRGRVIIMDRDKLEDVDRRRKGTLPVGYLSVCFEN